MEVSKNSGSPTQHIGRAGRTFVSGRRKEPELTQRARRTQSRRSQTAAAIAKVRLESRNSKLETQNWKKRATMGGAVAQKRSGCESRNLRLLRGDIVPPRVMTLGPRADCQATQGWTGRRSAVAVGYT